MRTLRITRREGRLCAGLAATSLAGFFILACLARDGGVLRALLARPLWSAVLTLVVAQAALAIILSLALWAQQAGPTDRRAYAGAIFGVIALSLGAQWLLPALGARAHSSGVAAQALPLALLFGMSTAACCALLLLGYRWLRVRRHWLALALYLSLILAASFLTMVGDRLFPLRTLRAILTRGTWEAIYDQLVLTLPLVLYELLSIRARAAAARATAGQPVATVSTRG
jgi:hypothetical protein